MADFFGKGIGVAAGFDLGAQAPLDTRTVVADLDELQGHIDGGRAYEGMLIYCEADEKHYVIYLEDGVQKYKVFVEDRLAKIESTLGIGDNTTTGGKSVPQQIKDLQDLVGAIPTEEVEGKQVAKHENIVDMIQDLVADEAARAAGQEADIRQEMAEALGSYTVEADKNGEGAVAASGLRGEIEEAHTAMNKALADEVAEIHGEMATESARVDQKIAGDIAAESALRVAEEGKIRQELANEKAALQQEIDDDIAAESALRVAEEQRIEGLVTAEVDRATAKEEELVGRLDTIQGGEDKEGSIKKAVADEAKRVDNIIGVASVEADEEAGTEAVAATGLRKEIEDADKALQKQIDNLDSAVEKELGNYTVPESGEGKGDGKAPSGLRKEIEERDAAALQSAKDYADAQITALVDSAPDAMNTLRELADAIDAHQDVYEAYVGQQSAKIGDLTKTGVEGADATDTDGKSTTNVAAQLKQLDADVKAEAGRAAGEEARIEGLVTAEAGRAAGEEARIEGLVTAEAGRADAEEKRIVGLVEAEAAAARAAEKANADAIDAHEAAVNAAIGTATTGVEDNTENGDNSLKALIRRAVDKAANDTIALQTNMAATFASLKAEIADGELILSVTENGSDINLDGDKEDVVIVKTTVPTMTDGEEEALLLALGIETERDENGELQLKKEGTDEPDVQA